MGPRFQDFEFQHIAPALSIILVSSLNVASQLLFRFIDPAPLTKGQAIKFNTLTAGLFICYFRTWLMDPGRIPKDWHAGTVTERAESDPRRRWCRKCEMPKPPRAHHCKSCKRCIPKMDHHCPWTANCVSHRTLPHFIRFLGYGVAAAGYLEYHLFLRLHSLWKNRHLPSYLGPSSLQLTLLFTLTIMNSITLTGVGILLLRCLYSIATNTTTIESWEISRHETLLRRARYKGGLLEGPDGTSIRITRQEFPYDIGIWANLSQAMGTRNPLAWPWPFAASLPLDAGLAFDTNGFEDEGTGWPPPDPDRLFRVDRKAPPEEDGVLDLGVEAFRARQARDLERYRGGAVQKRKPYYVRLKSEKPGVAMEEGSEGDEEDDDEHRGAGDHGEEAWRNAEGERLADFGVDEEVEFYDEDDVPLAELMRRRKQARQVGEAGLI